MKEYRVKTVKIANVILLSILLLLISGILPLYLRNLGFIEGNQVPLLTIVMMGITFLFLYNYDSRVKTFKVGKEGFQTDSKLITWDKIESYYIFDNSALSSKGNLTTFKINLKSGDSIKISHRNNNHKDDFFELTQAFIMQIYRFNKKFKEPQILVKDIYPSHIRKRIALGGVVIGIVIMVVILLDFLK